MSQVKTLNERCDDLQDQIVNMQKEKKQDWSAHEEKAKESLISRHDFNFEIEATAAQSMGSAPEPPRDGSVPSFGKFEGAKAKYLSNLKTERFREPRMFTME